MSRTRKMSIKGLTLTQYCIIVDIVRTTQRIMAWDEYMQEYTDHDNFLLSLNEEEYKELLNINL